MRRAYLDRWIALREWRARHLLDGDLFPGHFRKGHRARGCPRYCVHCRMLKSRPSRQQLRADLATTEWATEILLLNLGVA
jgi:hypothetical protein